MKKDAERSKRTIYHDTMVCLIFVVLAVFVYRDYIIEGKVAITPDTISTSAPFDQFAENFEERYGGSPLWYPHIFGGMPYQASGSYHNLQYSFEALINAILPSQLFKALHGRYFFPLLLGAISMYFLGRILSLSRWACFLATSAFVFSTHMMATEHANRFICFMHIPLVFLASYRVFDRGKLFDAIFLGGALGSQLCSFHPQIAFYTAMLIGLYAIYAVINGLRDKVPHNEILKKSALFTVGIAIAVAVAAILVFPLQEYAQFSARALSIGGSNVNVPFATSWSFPPIEILTFIIPSIVGFGGELYWGSMPFTDFPNYLGIIVIVLAVSGAIMRPSRITCFLVIAAVLSLLVSFGRHLQPVSYIMLHFVPFFGKFRAPVMILVLLQFSVALLAGYGLQALIERIRSNKDTLGAYTRRLCTIAGGVLVFVLTVTLLESSFQAFMTGIYEQADATHSVRSAILDNVSYHAQINAIRFDRFIDDLWIMTLFIVVFSVLLYTTRQASPTLCVAGICALVVLDLLIVTLRVVNPEDDPAQIENYYAARENDIVKTLKDDSSLYRMFPISEFNSNEYGYFGISTIGGYHPAKLGIYQELMDQVGFNSFPVLNMLNTKYLLSRQPLQGLPLTPVVESDSGYLYRNDAAQPRAFLVDSVKVITDKNTIFEELKSPEFNSRKYAILEKSIEEQLGPLADSFVEILRHTPLRIDLVVGTAAPCLLVLSEIYYPAGWYATINGDSAEIYKTNYVLRSLIVPEGRHEITLWFDPPTFSIGHYVSRIASALVLLTLISAGALRTRKFILNRR